MSIRNYSYGGGAKSAAPSSLEVQERDELFGYVERAARHTKSMSRKNDSGIIRVYSELESGVTNMNVNSLSEFDRGGVPSHRPASAAYRPIPVPADSYNDWGLMEDRRSVTVPRQLATPGAWAVAAVVVIIFVAFVFVTPAFASVGGGLSRYSDSVGVSVADGVAQEPVVDAGSGASIEQSQPVVQVASSDGTYSVIGSPSISVGQIERVLQQYNSPAAGLGQKLYDLGVQYGIDPAYALAFFVHESGCGTQGVARTTKSLGNIRVTPGWESYNGYRQYSSWEQGFEDWYKLITDLYINGWGLRTVDAIIPVYAPSGDNNSPPSYIASVKWMVDEWRGK